MGKLPEITLPNQLKDRLVQGHPWVYRNHLADHLRLSTGDWVKLRCGGWTGFALWDNQGPIALRIFSSRQLPDRRWLQARVQAAWDLRAPLRHQDCTAYRWLFGEGDGLPGLTVDLYGAYAVIQTYMGSGAVLLDWLSQALREIAPLEGILLRSQHQADTVGAGPATPEPANKTQLLWGKAPPADLVVREHGLAFQVNLAQGQKTGLFLDHRENRCYLETLSQGQRILNCFAYTGAFSLYALRGGARQVTSVDIGKGLAAAASINLGLNELDANRHSFVTGDCFEVLQDYSQSPSFDILVLDPPSFAKTKQNQYAALRAYTKLNALACKCIVPGGLLVSASCTSQISPQAFREMLGTAAAQANRRLQIIHEAGQPLDHPVPAQFNEGRYLKFIVGRVLELV